MRKRKSRGIRKPVEGWLAPISLSVILLLAVYGLAAGKIWHEVGPDVRYAELMRGKIQRCKKFGADCRLYACYRTDKGKFICTEG